MKKMKKLLSFGFLMLLGLLLLSQTNINAATTTKILEKFPSGRTKIDLVIVDGCNTKKRYYLDKTTNNLSQESFYENTGNYWNMSIYYVNGLKTKKIMYPGNLTNSKLSEHTYENTGKYWIESLYFGRISSQVIERVKYEGTSINHPIERHYYDEMTLYTKKSINYKNGIVTRINNYRSFGTKDNETYYNEDGIKEWYIVYGENNNRHDLTYYNEDGTKDREIRYHNNIAVWDYEIQYQENNIRGSVTYRSDDNLIYKVLNYGEVGMLSEEILYNSDEKINIIKAYNVLGESGEYYIVLNSIKQYENGLITQTDVYDDEGKYIIETKKYVEGIIERSIFYDEEKNIIDEVKYSQDEIDSITALALLNEGNGVETEKISEDGKNLIYERKLDYKGKEYVYTEIVEALDNEGVIESAENEEGTFTTKGYISSPWSKKKLYSYANYAMFSGYSGDGVFLMWTYTYFKVNRNNTITASRCEANSQKNLHAVGFPKITKSCSLTWSAAKKKGTFISGRGKFNITYSLGRKRTYYIDSFVRHEGSTQKGIYIRSKRIVTW